MVVTLMNISESIIHNYIANYIAKIMFKSILNRDVHSH